MPPIHVTFSIPNTEEKSYTTPYKPLSPGIVTQNFTLNKTGRISYQNKDRHISIENVPTMLVPTARVREDRTCQAFRDLVIPDNGLQTTHLAALYPSCTTSYSYRNRARSAPVRPKSKRNVAFCDMVESYSTEDSVDSESDVSEYSWGSSIGNEKIRTSSHLESYGSQLHKANFSQKRPSSSFTSDDVNKHRNLKGRRCSLCNQVNETKDRVIKYFGGVDPFLNWILSKWKKGSGQEHSSKDNYLIRGYAPHFCSFTQKVPLHERPLSSRTPREGWIDLDEVINVDKGYEDADSMYNGFSRNSFSNASGVDGRTTPSTTLHTEDNNKSATPIVDIVIASKTDDKNIDKGVIRFGFPVSKPPPVLSNKPSKPKKAVKKVTSNKKPKKEVNTISKSPKSAKSTQKSKKTQKNEALKMLEKIIDTSAKEDELNEQKDDEEINKNRSPIVKKEKNIKDKSDSEQPSVTNNLPPDLPKPVKSRSPSPSLPLPDITRPEVPEVPTIDPPDLPKLRTPEPPKEPKTQNKAQRSQISSPKSQKFKQDTESDSRSRPDFDINAAMEVHVHESSSKSKIQSWLHGRLALSQQSSRFELPMDMKNLESMSPLEYLRSHCVICNRRQNLYQKMYLKNKDKSGLIPLKDLEKALNDVLVNGINSEQLEEFIQLLLIPEDIKIDCRIFSCISAVIERLLYPKFVTADTAHLPDFQKEKIECADFCALDWKFHGVKVNPPVEKLIKSIQAVG